MMMDHSLIPNKKKKKTLKIDLTIRAETKELLAENIGVNVHDL